MAKKSDKKPRKIDKADEADIIEMAEVSDRGLAANKGVVLVSLCAVVIALGAGVAAIYGLSYQQKQLGLMAAELRQERQLEKQMEDSSMAVLSAKMADEVRGEFAAKIAGQEEAIAALEERVASLSSELASELASGLAQQAGSAGAAGDVVAVSGLLMWDALRSGGGLADYAPLVAGLEERFADDEIVGWLAQSLALAGGHSRDNLRQRGMVLAGLTDGLHSGLTVGEPEMVAEGKPSWIKALFGGIVNVTELAPTQMQDTAPVRGDGDDLLRENAALATMGLKAIMAQLAQGAGSAGKDAFVRDVKSWQAAEARLQAVMMAIIKNRAQ